MKLSARPRHPVTGKRFVVRGHTERELAAYLHRIDACRTELRLGMRSAEEIDRELRHLQHGPVTLERAAVAYLERAGLAPNTRRGVRSFLREHASGLLGKPLASLDAPTLGAWIEGLARKGLAASSVTAAWRKLRAIVAYAGSRGWIGAEPWGAWRPKKIGGPGRMPAEAARTLDELVRLLEACRDLDAVDYTGLWCKVMIATLLGLRQGELAGLRWSDVAWGPPLVLTIARQWDHHRPVKAKRVVRLESIGELALALRSHESALRHRGLLRAGGPIFPSPASEPGLPRAYAQGEVITRLQLRSAVERAKLPHGPALGAWTVHGLRATFVTLEVSAAGGDLKRAQSRTRHASLASLARYVRSLERSSPAPPAVRFLPGIEHDDAGDPLLSLP